MRSRGSTVAAAAAGIIALSITLMATPSGAACGTSCSLPNLSADAAHLLDLVNRDRAAEGVAPLAMRGDVVAIALGHSRNMAEAQNLSHNDAYFTASTRNNLNAKALGENVAENPEVDDAHARLMNSPSHRANLLDPKFTIVGIAIVQDEGGQYWITQDFMQPQPAAAPAPAKATPAPAAAAPAKPVAPAPTPAPAPVAVEIDIVPAAETAVVVEEAPTATKLPVALAADTSHKPAGQQNLLLTGALASMVAIGLAGTAIGVRRSMS